MNRDFPNQTVRFERKAEEAIDVRDVLLSVYQALKDKGYNPINQMVGYLISGDPSYITSYRNARNLITRLERDELLEALLKNYLTQQESDEG